MTTAQVPARVVLYAFATGEPQPAAELRWRPGAGVTLTVIEPVEGSIAQRLYDHGVHSYAEDRVVTRDEPAAFMRALVQPSQSGYSEFVDESERD
jgi:hypothetical protein